VAPRKPRLYSPAAFDTKESRLSTPDAKAAGERTAYALMAVAPILFASNVLVARAVAASMPPVALAFGRWGIATLLMLPLAARPLWRQRRAVRHELFDLFVLGILGMVICGAVVYIGARTTTATNIGLIYAASPVFMIVLARTFYGETMAPVQSAGVLLCLVGVVTIIARGDPGVLLGLTFTVGDLYVLGCSVAWAVYSVWIQHRRSVLAPTPRFTAITIAGVIALLPWLIVETVTSGPPPLDASSLGVMLFLAVVPGIAAYQTYAFVQRRLGTSRTSLLMYLIPVYNVGLAWALLGESLHAYHFVGMAMVLPGIYLATRRPGLLRAAATR
jgi:drug/metabolite transporter (DMT)-like permease